MVHVMRRSTNARKERIAVQVTRQAKALLKRAASVERKSVSAFILDKALAAAAETLVDRRVFQLNPKQFDSFVAALDANERPRPRLKNLLETSSVLE